MLFPIDVALDYMVQTPGAMGGISGGAGYGLVATSLSLATGKVGTLVSSVHYIQKWECIGKFCCCDKCPTKAP